jgi:hypothetical protein
MKSVLSRFYVIFILLFVTVPLACGGRVPSDVKTAKLTRSYFKKYGKKYKDTEFYKNPVKAVEIKKTQELQKNVATSFVLVSFAHGQEVPVILTLLRKIPSGWRITGWEWVKR